jgi:hypothetical protein
LSCRQRKKQKEENGIIMRSTILYCSPNTARLINKKEMKTTGRKRNAYIILVRKSHVNTSLLRLRCTWEDYAGPYRK